MCVCLLSVCTKPGEWTVMCVCLLSVCTKPGEWTVMCVSQIMVFAVSTIYLLGFDGVVFFSSSYYYHGFKWNVLSCLFPSIYVYYYYQLVWQIRSSHELISLTWKNIIFLPIIWYMNFDFHITSLDPNGSDLIYPGIYMYANMHRTYY
jgi:hypothetical protein